MPTTRLLLTAAQDEGLVAFEPYGAVATLKDEDAFTVEITGPGAGVVEIIYGPNDLTLGAWEGATTRVWNKSGTPVPV